MMTLGHPFLGPQGQWQESYSVSLHQRNFHRKTLANTSFIVLDSKKALICENQMYL